MLDIWSFYVATPKSKKLRDIFYYGYYFSPSSHYPSLLLAATEGFLKKILDYQNSFLFYSFSLLLSRHPPLLKEPRRRYTAGLCYA